MEGIPFKIVQILMFLTYLSTAVIAVSYRRQPNIISTYMNCFYLYPIVGVVDIAIIFASGYLKLIPASTMFIIDNYSLLFHFGFLSFFLSRRINRIGLLKHLNWWLLGYLLIILFSIILFDSTIFNSIAYGISNTGLFIICLIYYLQAFRSKKLSLTAREPFFWILNGVFFGTAIGIPIHLTGNYFQKNLSPSLYNLLASLAPLAYMLMYIFFIKAYLVAIKNKNHVSVQIF